MGKIKDFLFHNRNTRQTVIKNAFWLTTGQLGSRLFRAFFIIYAARTLGASEYGVFAYVLSLAGLFTIFADIGIGHILTRNISKKPEEGLYYLITSFWIKLVLLTITGSLIIFIAPYFSKIEAAKILLPIVALLTAFDGMRDLTLAFLRGREKMQVEALIMGFTNISITVFGLIILSLAPTPAALTLTYALSAGAGMLLGIFMLRKEFSKLFSAFRIKLLKPILSSALPIAFLGVLGIFMLHTDVLMLGFFKTSEEVGFYSASQKIVQLLYMLPGILAVSVFPALSRLIGQGNSEKVRALMEYSMRAVFLLALPLIIGGIVLGDSIISFLYGEAYLPGVLAFQILILSLLIIFPSYFLGNYIVGYDKQKKLAPYMLLGSIGNIALNAVLIPPFGIIGAAIGTVSTLFLYNTLVWFVAKKINNFYTLRYLKPILVAAVLMGFVSFALNILGVHVLINILISFGVYLTALIMLKESVIQEVKNTLFTGLSS